MSELYNAWCMYTKYTRLWGLDIHCIVESRLYIYGKAAQSKTSEVGFLFKIIEYLFAVNFGMVVLL
jgi:hypothetical protein